MKKKITTIAIVVKYQIITKIITIIISAQIIAITLAIKQKKNTLVKIQIDVVVLNVGGAKKKGSPPTTYTY